MTTIDYSKMIRNGNVYRCGEYVDKNTSVGNKNGKIDTPQEAKLFSALMETAFGNAFKNKPFDINGDIQAQANIMENIDNEAKETTGKTDGKRFLDTRNRLYSRNGGYTGHDLSFVGENCGYEAGMEFAHEVIGYTSKAQHEHMKKTIERLTKEYCPELNDKMIKNFLRGYYVTKGKTDSGFFEQLAHENDSSKITNGEAAAIMKRILHAVPLNQRNSYDYKLLNTMYKKYAELPSNELFEEKQTFGRIFGKNEMDDLDDAVERLFNL